MGMYVLLDEFMSFAYQTQQLYNVDTKVCQ